MYLIDEVKENIRSLKIQGATNVALAVLDALESITKEIPDVPRAVLQQMGETLAYTRPTEPLAQNAIRYIFAGETSPILRSIEEYRTYIEKSKHEIPTIGKSLLTDGGVYLTLCHSGTTVDLFKAARSEGRYFSMYVAETRPRFQGRTTATELLEAGFDDVTMIIDDVAVALLEGRRGKIDAVFIGADLLTETGFVNKVGSLALTAAALRNHIPVYSLTTLLKYDPRPFNFSLIETRSSEEIWKDSPQKLQFYAPAFDYVPYFQNVSLVSEAGILKGKQVRSEAEKHYPFIIPSGRVTQHTYG